MDILFDNLKLLVVILLLNSNDFVLNRVHALGDFDANGLKFKGNLPSLLIGNNLIAFFNSF